MDSQRSQRYAQMIEVVMATFNESGLTKKEVCDRLGKPKNYLIKIERGERRLDLVETIALCEAMDQDPSELIARVMAIWKLS